jgi:CRP-like cAMP-binding protein
MYALVEGEVEISVASRVLETAGPGALIGEMALIENAPRSATAQAITDCVVVPVPQKEFLFLVQEHPTFAIQVMRVMAERLRRMDHP